MQRTENTEKVPRGLTLEQARAFVGGKYRDGTPVFHLVEENRLYGRCIDGRYEPGTDADGSIAMAGGDAGLLAIALALAEQLRHPEKGAYADMMDEEVREIIYKIVNGKDKFHYHSDTHTHNNGLAEAQYDGCGHCQLLKEHPEAYLLTLDQGAFLQATLTDLERSGISPVVLKGRHEERAVFVVEFVHDLETKRPVEFDEWRVDVNIRSWALESQAMLPGDTEPSQVFVYNRGLVRFRLATIADAFAKYLPTRGDNVAPDILLKDLSEVEAIHLELTTHQLAQGKPVFTVYVDTKTGIYEVEEGAR